MASLRRSSTPEPGRKRCRVKIMCRAMVSVKPPMKPACKTILSQSGASRAMAASRAAKDRATAQLPRSRRCSRRRSQVLNPWNRSTFMP